MSAETRDDDRAWTAEKRDFVADARDETADARGAVADARDVAADAREAELDRREDELREADRSGPLQAAQWTDRDAARAGRVEWRQGRADAASVRKEAKAARDEARSRRLTEGRPTLLALAFASIAEQLYEAETYDEVLARIAEAAVATVAGSDAASVTVLEENGYRTAGSTAPSAARVDRAQYDVGEGPCLDAVHISPVVSAPGFPDQRWPRLGAAPTGLGVRSSVSYHLRSGDAETPTGALNIYAMTPDAFSTDAVDIGGILAAHASLAARAIGERTSVQRVDHDLQAALLSRDVIGQAKGILMERLNMTPDQAFDILRDSSQRLNVKLREVARNLTETGEITPRKP